MTGARRVLVTGGAGYIGSHCCKALSREGIEPVVYDNLSRGHEGAVKWGPFVQGDVRDRQKLVDTFTKYQIDSIIHFAAFAYVGESVQNPQMYYDNNLGGMSSLLDALRQVGIATVVLSSSCATYGVPDQLPIAETTPQRPINPYGRTKLICEWMLEDAERAHSLRFAALRYFNAAGSDPEGEIGENHEPETHLVPLVILAALDLAPPIQVFGTDYPTPDGTCIRDYIHVNDLARAHVLALKKLWAGSPSLKVNLGTGSGLSVKQVIDAVERVTGRKVPLHLSDRRDGDPPELVANPDLAREILGFKTQCSDIDQIVQDAYAWFAGARLGNQIS